MRTGNRWRQATVWMHVLMSVGWMAEVLTLMTLLVIGTGSGDLDVREGARVMAHKVDTYLLAGFANGSALTGIVLATATPWGLVRHWWVLVKFGVTTVQLVVAIFVLSPVLDATAAGDPAEPVPWLQIAGTAGMAAVIAYQAWLSVAKPWGRTRWNSGGKPPAGPRWVFVAAVVAPLADLGVAAVAGFPSPLFSLIVLVWWLVVRRRRRVEVA